MLLCVPRYKFFFSLSQSTEREGHNCATERENKTNLIRKCDVVDTCCLRTVSVFKRKRQDIAPSFVVWRSYRSGVLGPCLSCLSFCICSCPSRISPRLRQETRSWTKLFEMNVEMKCCWMIKWNRKNWPVYRPIKSLAGVWQRSRVFLASILCIFFDFVISRFRAGFACYFYCMVEFIKICTKNGEEKIEIKYDNFLSMVGT